MRRNSLVRRAASRNRRKRVLSNDLIAKIDHRVEMLEPRLLLSASPLALAGDDDLSDFDVSPAWFAEVSPSTQPESSNHPSAALGKKGRKGRNRKTKVPTTLIDGKPVAMISNQWIVRLTSSGTIQAGTPGLVDSLLDLNSLGAHTIEGLGIDGMVLVETDGVMDATAFRNQLAGHSKVRYVTPNRILTAKTVPSDKKFKQQWGLHNRGRPQNGMAKKDVDIDAPEAWDITTGDPNIVIGIIDSGVNYLHKDLADNMWVNPGEIADDGEDNDENGFVDDVYGWDFYDSDADPMDRTGHGTQVAGVVAATGNNNQGMTGVSQVGQIMALRWMGPGNSGANDDAIKAINYATMMRTDYGINIRLTNNSWSVIPEVDPDTGEVGEIPIVDEEGNDPLLEAIEAHNEAGILFVAAAGNSASNNDVIASFPDTYDVDNIISVGAATKKGRLAKFSNYGARTVHVVAPGQKIYSTHLRNKYRYGNGTSLAAPHVSGVAMLLWAHDPSLSVVEVKEAIMAGSVPISPLQNRIVGGGMVNAYRSLQFIDGNIAPDFYEGNDSVAEVDLLKPSRAGSANLGTITAPRLIYGLNTLDGTDDLFRFNMNADGGVPHHVKINFANDLGDLDLQVLAADGVTIVGQSMSSFGDGEAVSLTGKDAGAYYVRVWQADGATNPNYTLTIDPGVLNEDAYEGNNASGEVLELESGVEGSSNLGLVANRRTIKNLNTLDASEDWYAFYLRDSHDNNYGVNIHFRHKHGDVDMALYANEADALEEVAEDAEAILSSLSVTDNEYIRLTGLEEGFYWLRVWGHNGAVNPNYTLAVRGPKPEKDPPGQSRKTAQHLPGLNLGTIAKNGYVGMRDPIDTFLMRVGQPRIFTFTLEAVTGPVKLELIKDNVLLEELEIEEVGEEMLIEDYILGVPPSTGLPGKGNYYLRVMTLPTFVSYYNLTIESELYDPGTPPGKVVPPPPPPTDGGGDGDGVEGDAPGVFAFVDSGQIFPSDRAAFVDYNNDGWVDLAAGMLWTNDGEGNLEDVLSLPIGGTTWGDFNNDGFEDFYSWSGGQMWRNDEGTGDFTMIELPDFPSYGAAGKGTWIDIDLDGFLDLYVGGYENWPVGYYPDSILRNNGDETFDHWWTQPDDAEITPGQPRPARGLSTVDYDEDGDADVYVSNYRLEPNGLWESDGSGNITDVAVVHGATGGYGHTIGSAVGDINNDGHFDIFAGNFSHPGQEPAHFLSNSGPDADWAFVKKAALDGGNWQESYASGALGDLDNDTDLDLLFTTVYSGDVTRFYDNQGNWSFINMTEEAGLEGFAATYQAAFGDVDNDGDLDVVSNNGLLYINETENEYSWLKLKIEGDPAQGINLSAIGAQVRVTLDSGAIVARQVEASTGAGNAHEKTLHFGLGEQEDPVDIEVRWPGGLVHTIEDVELNKTFVVDTNGQLTEVVDSGGGGGEGGGGFTDVTVLMGLHTDGAGHSGFGDINNDGWTDLNWGSQIWVNNAGNSFTFLQQLPGEGLFGDFDNDGLLDVMADWWNAGKLFRNVNGTEFVDDGLVTGPFKYSRGATAGDFNNDGFLDAYTGGYWDEVQYFPDHVIMSNGGTSYTTTEVSGSTMPTRGVTAADFDEDNDLDVYLSWYHLLANVLLQNNGSGGFTNMASSYGATGGNGHSIGAAWGDIDNDGHMDLFAGNFAHAGQPESRWLRNQGPVDVGDDYTFEDMGTGGVVWKESFASPSLGDYDNDGDLDLFFTTVYGGDSSVLYRNDGNWTFTNVTTDEGLPGVTSTYQNAWGDYDNDGDLDLVFGGRLYRNDLDNSNNWLKLLLKGDPAQGINAAAIGAVARIDLGGGEVLTRQVEGGTGEGNQNDLVLHFGLGDHSGSVDVEITWPGGLTKTYSVLINRLVEVTV